MWPSTCNVVVPIPIVKIQSTQAPTFLSALPNLAKPAKKISKERSKKKKTDDEQYVVRSREQQALLIRWSRIEDQVYMNFLKNHSKFFSSQNLRRTGKVFMQLSKIMGGTRTPNQCKSHHQKMQKATQNGTIQEIITYLQHKHSFPVEKQVTQNKITKNSTITMPDGEVQSFFKITDLSTSHENLIEISINFQLMEKW